MCQCIIECGLSHKILFREGGRERPIASHLLAFLLADEAFGDLLAKHNRPRTLKDALKQSAKRGPANENKPKSRPSS